MLKCNSCSQLKPLAHIKMVASKERNIFRRLQVSVAEKKTTFPLSRVKKKCTAARLKRIDVHYEGFKKI